MIAILQTVYKPLLETLFLTFVPLIFASIFGLIIGTLIFISSDNCNILENKNTFWKVLNKISDTLVNIFRAVPYIILLIWLIPLAKLLTGHMLGATAALPSLIVSATPFVARMCVLAFNEVDKGVLQAGKAMGASVSEIIFKVLYPEAMPALVSGIIVTAINLISYSAMAGAIGAGGLGFTAYNNGLVRTNYPIFYTTVILIVALVFLIQYIGDKLVEKIDKR